MKTNLSITIVLIIVTLSACGKSSDNSVDVALRPTLTTSSLSSITSSTAICGGNITSDGGANIITRGVCWNSSIFPTTANNKTSDGTGNGTYTSPITGLTANTTYYVRAYATNEKGITYGSTVNFKTLDNIVPVSTTKNGYILTQNETWSGAILLKGDIVVPSGITLTINPGTIITISTGTPVYDGGVSSGKIDLYIYGSLIINGTAQNIVQLKSAASSPKLDEWYGIYMGGNQLEISYCYISDANTGVICGSSSTAMKIKNSLFNNSNYGIADFGSLQHTLSYNSFVNVLMGYTSFCKSNINKLIDYSEFKNNSFDIYLSGTSTYAPNNLTVNVNYSNFSANKSYNLYWSSGGSVTNCNITTNHCYGITTYLTNGNGNTYTYTNQLTTTNSGAGCGFSFMAKSPSSRSRVISSNPEQLKRKLQEHDEEIKQQYEKMKRKQTY